MSPKHGTQNRTSYNAAIIQANMSREYQTIGFLTRMQSPMMLKKPQKTNHETGQMACINIETDHQEHLPLHGMEQGAARYPGSCTATTSPGCKTF